MAADGTLYIETAIDTEGFTADGKDVEAAAKRMAKTVSGIGDGLDLGKALKDIIDVCGKLQRSMEKLSDTAKQAFSGAGSSAKKAAAEVKKLGDEEAYAAKQAKALDNIKITRMEGITYPDEDEPPRFAEVSGSGGHSREAIEAAEEYAEALSRAGASSNYYKKQMEELEKTLSELEGKGLYFGDDEYDEAYISLRRLDGELKEYIASLNSASQGVLEIDTSTMEANLDGLKQKLRELKREGFGLGDKEYDQTVVEVGRVSKAIRDYRKELLAQEPAADRQAEELRRIGEGAKVSRPYIVKLRKELEALLERQKLLEKAGAGPGYEEYDANARKIKRLKEALAGYTGETKKAARATGLFGNAWKKLGAACGKLVSGVGKLSARISASGKAADKSRMSMAKMLGMSLLFSTVFRAISSISGGAAEGMQNLAQYSASANAGLSLLMSSLTRLKNSFATAFSPVLSVVAPIMGSFINMLSAGATYAGMFFAALTGQDTFTRAKAVQQDYAASLDSTAKSAGNAAEATKDAAKAAEGSLAPWDELNVIQMDLSDTMDNMPDASTPEAAELTPQDMFEEVPIKSSIRDFADRIKKLVKAQDWSGIGKLLGQQINKGLRKLNAAIRWDNVGDEITRGVDAITGIFNSMVDEIDWRYLGDTAGEGLTTLFRTLNQLMEKTDWENLGKGFGEAVNGLFETADWDQAGRFLGNRIMVLWDTLYGLFTDLEYSRIGKSLAEGLNGLADAIDPETIGTAIYSAVNGAFDTAGNFAGNVKWDALADKISDGINTAVHGIDWKENGADFNRLLEDFLGMLLGAAEDTDWEAFGKGVGEFLSEIDWGTHLKTLLGILREVLGGIWEGLGETSAGKFVQAVIAFKVGMKLMPVVDSIVSFFTGESVGQKMASAFRGMFSRALTDAASSGTGTAGLGNMLKSAFSSAAGSTFAVGLTGIGGAIAGTIALSAELDKLIELVNGGNGILTESGGALQSFIQALGSTGQISEGQAKEAFLLEEAYESAGKSVSESVQGIMDKLAEFGVSNDTAKKAIEGLWQEQGISEEMYLSLASAADTLGSSVETMTGKLDLSKAKTEEAYQGMETALKYFGTQSGLTNEAMTALETVLYGQEDAGATAQETYDALMQKIEDMGGNAQLASDLIATELPEAFQTAGKDALSNFEGSFLNGKELGEKLKSKFSGYAAFSTEGWNRQMEKEKQGMEASTKSLITNAVISPVQEALGIASPSKLFADFARYCGEGFERNLDASFAGTLGYFRRFGTVISSAIGNLEYIGHNAITGINNGMVAAADTLYANARAIASNIAATFRDVLQIHSPSRVMEILGAYIMEGLGIGMEGWKDKVTGLAQEISESVQDALSFEVPKLGIPAALTPPSAGVYLKRVPVMAQGTVIPPQAERAAYSARGASGGYDMEALIKRALAENQQPGDAAGIVQAFREAISGMAVYAEDEIIGYLRDKNLQEWNRSGHGILEGGW